MPLHRAYISTKGRKIMTGTSCSGCLVKVDSLSVILNKEKLLNNINFDLHCGEMTALIGPNGAGKTTLLKAMLGEVPHSGDIIFYPSSGGATAPKLGYVPQSARFDKGCPISVSDLFMTVSADKKRMSERLDIVKTAHLADRKIGNLSGGELQRVLLAFALFPEIPDLLILDEPVTGMDKSGQEIFYQLLHSLLCEYHTSVLIVSHDLGMVKKHADKVCFLCENSHLFGTPDEVFASDQFKKTFLF